MKTSNWGAFIDYCDYVSLTQLLLPLFLIVIRGKIYIKMEKMNEKKTKLLFLQNAVSNMNRVPKLEWWSRQICNVSMQRKWEQKIVQFFFPYLPENSRISNLSTKCHCNCLGQQTLIRKTEKLYLFLLWYKMDSLQGHFLSNVPIFVWFALWII